nr:hypothetical protein [Tanacetum cinerariifolium]
MNKAFPLPVMEFPLREEVPTASEETSHYQKKRDATVEKIALLLKSSSNSDPDDVSMIQMASHLSPNMARDIQMASPEHGLESSSIFIPEMEDLLEKFRHHHHHHHCVDEMTCLDDERMKKKRNDVPYHDHFKVVEFLLEKKDA